MWGIATGNIIIPPPPLPTVTLTATPTSVLIGATTLLQWSSTDAATVTASGGWSGLKAFSGSEVPNPLSVTTVFDIAAANVTGSALASATVIVSAPPAPSAPASIVVRPGGRAIIAPQRPGEVAIVRFDFISSVQKTDAIVAQVVTASVYSGTDPNPENVIVGTATVNGTIVKQSIRGGLVGVTYALLCRCTTASGHNPEISAYLTIIKSKEV
jgi:hypothetical protein